MWDLTNSMDRDKPDTDEYGIFYSDFVRQKDKKPQSYVRSLEPNSNHNMKVKGGVERKMIA